MEIPNAKNIEKRLADLEKSGAPKQDDERIADLEKRIISLESAVAKLLDRSY